MKKIGLFIVVIMGMAGCATVPFSDYIKADHPYMRKISGNYNKIIEAAKIVLFKENWKIQSELNPSVYERNAQGEDQSKDVLLMTEIKHHPKIIYSSYTHLNIFIHAIADGAEVEIRYEIFSPTLIKQFHGSRNDPLAKRFLDKIEEELESK